MKNPSDGIVSQNLIWMVCGYVLAILPLLSAHVLSSLTLSPAGARWLYPVTPLALGVLGVTLGIVNWGRGQRWSGLLQTGMAIASALWALVIAGFALSVNFGGGL